MTYDEAYQEQMRQAREAYADEMDTGETPLEWLRSHLPVPEDDARTMDATDLRCIRQAIAGLMERDTLQEISDGLCESLRKAGAKGHHLAALVYDLRDKYITLRDQQEAQP